MSTSKNLEPHSYLVSALLDLYRTALDGDELSLYAATADGAAAVTRSEIAYFHLVNDDQETIELGTWSAKTLRGCKAAYDRHYPISRAGVWADSARERRALIHNDYQGLSTKRGYPPGHVHLVRHLGVPVFAGDRIVLLVGVGNKPVPYDEDDERAVQVIADTAWQLIARNRRIHDLDLSARQFRDLQQFATISVWSWDPDDRTFVCDDSIDRIFGFGPGVARPGTIDELLQYIDVRDHGSLLDHLCRPHLSGTFDAELRGHHVEGSSILVHVRGNACPRSQGRGVQLRGILQDITERRELSRIRYDATHDTLTGLANRSALLEHLERRLRTARRKRSDCLAVHYMDLDRFKPVNDAYGHSVGDQVLRMVAQRLERATREGDLVARLGGDEFVIVQQDVFEPAAAESLAAKLVAAVGEPIRINNHEIRIGVSIGVVIAAPGVGTADELLLQADQALYEAKRLSGNGWRLATGCPVDPSETD